MEQKAKVVVTTKHRGVFFGTLEKQEGTEVHLSDARVCVYWGDATRGFVGLAATGPLKGSKVSPACPAMELVDVTAILRCTDKATSAWESEPWS